jgi:hypothetical protein
VEKLRRLIFSLLVTLTCIAVVVAVVGSLFYFQWWTVQSPRDCTFAVGDRTDNCREEKQTQLGPWIAQGLNSVMIMVMNAVYAQVRAHRRRCCRGTLQRAPSPATH